MLTEWYAAVAEWLPNLLWIALILLLATLLARRAQGLVRRVAERARAPHEIAGLLGRAAYVVVLAFGVLLVLDRLNLSGAVLNFIAGLGIVGIIIGFALQDIVKQFAAGVLLLVLQPFRAGDEVQIGAFAGSVVQVQLRATVLKTAEGDEVLIPNADVYSTAIVNRSRYAPRRRTLAFSLPLAADLVAARAALLRALAALPGVAATPPPEVQALGLADGAATLDVYFWVAPGHSEGDVQAEVVEAIRRVVGGDKMTG